MGEGGRASEKLAIICRCGARKAPDEQFCDYCYAMAEEPDTYWDENSSVSSDAASLLRAGCDISGNGWHGSGSLL
jgi:hypothetical protein